MISDDLNRADIRNFKIKLENHYIAKANEIIADSIKKTKEQAEKIIAYSIESAKEDVKEEIKNKYFPGRKRVLTDEQRKRNRIMAIEKYYQKKKNEKKIKKIQKETYDIERTEFILDINNKLKMMNEDKRKTFKLFLTSAFSHLEI